MAAASCVKGAARHAYSVRAFSGLTVRMPKDMLPFLLQSFLAGLASWAS